MSPRARSWSVENSDAPLDAIASAADRELPFERSIRAIEVLVEDTNGRWRLKWRLPLSADAAEAG